MEQKQRDPRLTKNAKYWWKKRATAVEEAQYQDEMNLARDMQRALDYAYTSIEKEIYALYGKYAENNQMTLAEARKYLTDAEREEFRYTLQQYTDMARNNSDGRFDKLLDALSTRARVSRLEALQARSALYIRGAYGGMDSAMLSKLEGLIIDTSMRTAYDIQTAKAYYEPFAQVDKKSIDRVLAKPWAPDGKTFSARLWTNQKDLINAVQDEMVKGFISGVDSAAMTKRLVSQFGVAKYAAQRLAVTEGAYFASLAAGDTYKEYDVEKYQILATLDDKTCDICASLDGEIHDMKEYRPGDTAPPFHPNCRTTTIPYIENNVLNGKEKRAARDPKTGKTVLVDGELTYPEWEKQFVEVPQQKGGIDTGGHEGHGVDVDVDGSDTGYTGEKIVHIGSEQDAMSNSFRPRFGKRTSEVIVGSSASVKLKKVENSQTGVWAEDTLGEKELAIRVIEKIMREVKKQLGTVYTPDVGVIDFTVHFGEKYGSEAAVYDKNSGMIFFNKAFRKKSQVENYINKYPGWFCGKTAEAVAFHEIGHAKYYELINSIAEKQGISYTKAENIVESAIDEFVSKNGGIRWLSDLSDYAAKGYADHKYGEIFAEAYHNEENNKVAEKFLEFVMGLEGK